MQPRNICACLQCQHSNVLGVDNIKCADKQPLLVCEAPSRSNTYLGATDR